MVRPLVSEPPHVFSAAMTCLSVNADDLCIFFYMFSSRAMPKIRRNTPRSILGERQTTIFIVNNPPYRKNNIIIPIQRVTQQTTRRRKVAGMMQPSKIPAAMATPMYRQVQPPRSICRLPFPFSCTTPLYDACFFWCIEE